MNGVVFVDTNVYVYARDASRAGKQAIAAQLQDCTTLLTEDLQDGMVFDEVTVQNPFRQRAEEPRIHYAVESGIARRHRRPGRPRKAAATAS